MQQLEVKLAEKHIRDANEELSDKVKALETAKKQVAVKEGVLNHKKSELQKIIVDTEKEETALNKVSGEARSHIDERLIYSYDRIRNSYRNGLAVVPVERDACGGCFNSIPPQRQSEIRLHKKIIVCENCGRILVDADMNDTVEAK
jgi:predicted  nucleic acid-binding Zn-ribbon protein